MEEIYKEYYQFVYKYLLYLSKNRELSEELTQETFYSAIKNINKFRNDCNISTWLCQIAKNKYFKELKKTKPTLSIEDFENNIRTENLFEDDFIVEDEKLNLYKKIHKLDSNTREVFYLRIKGEMTFKQIGEIMSKTEQWARTTFYRGKLKLKEEYDNENKQ